MNIVRLGNLAARLQHPGLTARPEKGGFSHVSVGTFCTRFPIDYYLNIFQKTRGSKLRYATKIMTLKDLDMPREVMGQYHVYLARCAFLP